MSIVSEIILRLKNAGVKSGLERTKNQFKSLSRDISKSLAKVALGGGVVASIAKAADHYDRLAKSVSKLGLSSRFMQQLDIAARKAGLGSQAAQVAMQRFVRRLAEAREGTGEAIDAARELNIQFADQHGKLKTSEVLFQEVADALAEVSRQDDRVRLGMKFFDTEGVGILNAIKNGYSDIADAAAGVRLLSDQELENIQAANDMIEELKLNVLSLAGSGISLIKGGFDAAEKSLTRKDNQFQTDIGQSRAFEIERDIARLGGLGDEEFEEARAVQEARLQGEIERIRKLAEKRYRTLEQVGFSLAGESSVVQLEGYLAELSRLELIAKNFDSYIGREDLASRLTQKEEVARSVELAGLKQLEREESRKAALAEGNRKAAHEGVLALIALHERELLPAHEKLNLVLRERQEIQNKINADSFKDLSGEDQEKLVEDLKAKQREVLSLQKEAGGPDLDTRLEELRLKHARDRLTTEEKITALKKEQRKLQDDYPNLKTDQEREDAANRVLEIERELQGEKTRLLEEEKALRATIDKPASLQFRGGIDRIRNIGGTLGNTTVRLEKSAEANELKVAEQQLAQLEKILNKIPAQVALPGVESRG